MINAPSAQRPHLSIPVICPCGERWIRSFEIGRFGSLTEHTIYRFDYSSSSDWTINTIKRGFDSYLDYLIHPLTPYSYI